MGLMKLLGTAFNTILDGGDPTADRTITFPDVSGQVALTSEVIGIGQTWQNMTASRVAGTTYTNNTGKPIMVSVDAFLSSASVSMNVFVDGHAFISYSRSVSSYSTDSVIVIVPNGSTYSVLTTNVSSITRWLELR